MHTEAFAARHLEPELYTGLTDTVKTVNFAQVRPLNSRLFAALCHEMGADHVQLLLHTEIHWLSCGQVLQCVFELHKELGEFLTNASYSHGSQFKDHRFLAKLAYLADTFNLQNDLNLSLQGKCMNISMLSDKVMGFRRKLSV